METGDKRRPLELDDLFSHLAGAWVDSTRVFDTHQVFQWQAALDRELRASVEEMLVVELALGAARKGYALVEMTGPAWWLMPSDRRDRGALDLPPAAPDVKALHARGFPLWDPAQPGDWDQEQWLPAACLIATGVPILRREPNP